MKKHTLFFTAYLIGFMIFLTTIAWADDLYLQGTLDSGVYTSDGNIITQNTCIIDTGAEVYLIAYESTILNPGFRVKAGARFVSMPSDRDSLPDDWEIQYCGTLTYGPNDDSDSDELTNLEEYQIGTHPCYEDTDYDGMPDGWEVQYGLNPLYDDANDDSDEDGASNYLEYVCGTDPSDPGSTPPDKVYYYFNYDSSGNLTSTGKLE